MDLLSRFVIEGHRGVQSLYPENTLASFQAAIDLGLEWVELDLLSTKEGEIVIHHDFAIQNRLISSMTFDEIQKFDVGKTNPKFPLQKPISGARIPRLSELFEMVTKSNGKNLQFNLEIKSDPSHPEYTPPLDLIARRIAQVVEKYQLEQRVYYSSFDPAALRAIRDRVPSPTMAFLYYKGLGDDWVSPLITICKELNAQIVSPNESLLSELVMSAFKKGGLFVIPWTVNDKSRFSELVSMGINGVITDYPQQFL